MKRPKQLNRKRKVINSADKFKDPDAKEEGSGAGAKVERRWCKWSRGRRWCKWAGGATGMKIKDQQPSESDIADDR